MGRAEWIGYYEAFRNNRAGALQHARLRGVRMISQWIIENLRNIQQRKSTFYLTGSFIRILMGKLDKMVLAYHPRLFS